MHCLFAAELEGLYPEELEGIDTILDRTEQRIVRQRSLSSDRSLKKLDTPTPPTDGVQQGEATHHGRSSTAHHHTSLRERTLQNIAESDDVFLDENLTESLV
jgi:hypothetical protein